MTTDCHPPDFDTALLDVSGLLADACSLERQGSTRRAVALYALAERCALSAGYVELLQLVWAYTPAARPIRADDDR